MVISAPESPVKQEEQLGLGGMDSFLDELAEQEASAAAIETPSALQSQSDTPPGEAAPAGARDRAGAYGLAPPKPTAAATAPGAVLPEVQGEEQTCPGCGESYPASAKICVPCGVYLKTGRALLTTQEDNLDSIYATAETVIRFLSWVIWVGIYPIASEAFGTCKPYISRGIAILTVLISVWFFVVMWTDSPNMSSYQNLMLWAGEADLTEYVRGEWRDEFPAELELDDEELARIIEELMAEETVPVGKYRPSQLITHAFLHGDLIHLAGNLLFLMVFGTRVNTLIGSALTLLLYSLFAVAAGLAHMAASVDSPPHPCLGASGAVMGMAGMYLVLFPVHKVHMAYWWRWGLVGGFHLSTKLFAVRGFWVVLFYIAFDVLYTAIGLEDNVAHWAHLGGFIAGVVVALILLFSRVIHARGGDIVSVILGRHAWALIGKPNRKTPLICRL